MSYPVAPTVLYSFTGFQTASPTVPLPADQIDAQFANHKASLDEIIAFFQISFTAEGLLQPGSVPTTALADDPQASVVAATNAAAAAVTAQGAAETAQSAAETARDEAEAIVGFAEAPQDGMFYARQDAAWVSFNPGAAPDWAEITNKPSVFPPEAHNHTIADVTGLQTALDAAMPRSGGAFTGAIILTGNPVQNFGAATKIYVDNLIAGTAPLVHSHQITDVSGLQTTLDNKLSKAGGTMTGSLTLPGNPTIDLHATTKQYVDIAIALNKPQYPATGNPNELDFPIGSVVQVVGAGPLGRNTAVAIYLSNGNSIQYTTNSASGQQLVGTWAHRGDTGGGAVCQRIA